MTRARLALLAPVACVALLAGCADAVDGSADTAGVAPVTSSSTSIDSGSSSGSASSPGSPSAAPTGNFPQTVPEVAALLLSGNSSITSAHIEFTFAAGGQKIAGTGDQALSDGRATSFELREQVPSVGELEIRNIEGVLYVKGFPNHGTAAKPWIKITANTTDTTLRSIYESQQQSSALGSLEGISIFLKAAEALKFDGTDEIDGDVVGKYSLVVNTTKLPADFPNKSQIVASGITSIPVQIAVDEQGRTRRAVTTIKIGATTATSEFALSKFNAPVDILAPPASQTTTS